MGPHAPEVLTFELVHTVLCDARFTTAPGLGLRPHTDPGTRSAVVGAAGPVQHLPPGIGPGFDRVTPTQNTSSGLRVSSRSRASTLGRR
jgi:hypothetical protein